MVGVTSGWIESRRCSKQSRKCSLVHNWIKAKAKERHVWDLERESNPSYFVVPADALVFFG